MSERFDELARSLARPMPRRAMVRLVAGSVAGLAFGGLRAPLALAQFDGCEGDSIPCGGSTLDCYLPGRDTCCPTRNDNVYASDVVPFDTDAVCCWDKAGNAVPLGAAGWTCCGGTTPCPPEGECCGDVCCPEGKECIRGECEFVCKNEKRRGMSRVWDKKTQCCTEDGIAQKYPIKEMDYYRCEKTRVKRDGYEPPGNGFCGPDGGPRLPDGYGEANFLPHCQAHDACYDTCRSKKSKCDKAFCKRLFKACKRAYPKDKGKKGPMRIGCEERARDYCDGVVALGGGSFNDAQSKACQCCP